MSANSSCLLEFLEEYKVVIPVMQREYAQGRMSEKGIREHFLSSLLESIENSTPLFLDFIYGYKSEKMPKDFLPIDGQQRLTTLWLLHIYLLDKSFVKERSVLKKFSYKTRDNTKNFCDTIVLEFEKTNDKPSEWILDKALSSDSNDASVKAMLTMLDAIHEKFKNISFDNIAERLANIKFTLIDMGYYNLGEELYIKMNARGKLLSTFDNFKAWISEDDTIRKDIVLEIDEEWIPLFWKTFFDENNETSFDIESFMFIHLCGIFFILKKGHKISDQLLSYDSCQKLDKSSYIFDKKSIFTLEHLRFIDYMVNEFKSKPELLDTYKKILKFGEEKPEEITANLIIKILVFFYYFYDKYKYNKEVNMLHFMDWMSIFHHIVDNYRFSENKKDYIEAMFKFIQSLAKHSENIFKYLSDDIYKIPTSSFKDRVEEEIKKAKLIISDRSHNNGWEVAINNVQNNIYFNGRIDFLLTYSKNIDSGYSIENFKNYSRILVDIFSDNFILNKNKNKNKNNELHLLQSSLLSFTDYVIYNSNWFLGDKASDQQNKHDSWYKIFLNDHNGSKKVYPFRDYLDKILQYDQSIPTHRLVKIIRDEYLKKCSSLHNTKEWWRDIICNYPQVLEVCNDNRISFRDKNKDKGKDKTKDTAYLLQGKKLNKNGYSLIIYGFHCYLSQCDLTQYNISVTEYDIKNPEKNEKRFTIIIDKREYSIKGHSKDITVYPASGGNKIATLEYNFDKCCKENYKTFIDKIIN